jgi:hypothetical protein
VKTWPTIPDLARAVGVPEKILQEMADEGILPIFQNPAKTRKDKKAKRYVNPYRLEETLRKVFDLPPPAIQEVLKKMDFFGRLSA